MAEGAREELYREMAFLSFSLEALRMLRRTLGGYSYRPLLTSTMLTEVGPQYSPSCAVSSTVHRLRQANANPTGITTFRCRSAQVLVGDVITARTWAEVTRELRLLHVWRHRFCRPHGSQVKITNFRSAAWAPVLLQSCHSLCTVFRMNRIYSVGSLNLTADGYSNPSALPQKKSDSPEEM